MERSFNEKAFISDIQELYERGSDHNFDEFSTHFTQWHARWGGIGQGSALLDPAIIYAASDNRVDIVSFMLANGCDPYFHSTTFGAIIGGATDVLQFCYDNGWDINGPASSQTIFSSDPMSFCHFFDDENVLDWFLAHGANLNNSANGDHTAMDIAAAFCSREVIIKLLSHGGDLLRSNTLQWTIRIMHRKRKSYFDMLDFLLMSGADIDLIEHHRTSSSRRSSVLERRTALHYAVGYDIEMAVRMLLERGANPNVRTSQGRTAADLARHKGFYHLLPYLEASEGQDDDKEGNENEE